MSSPDFIMVAASKARQHIASSRIAERTTRDDEPSAPPGSSAGDDDADDADDAEEQDDADEDVESVQEVAGESSLPLAVDTSGC